MTVRSDLRNEVLAMLDGRLWHTTSMDRFQEILRSGAILPNPSIPDEQRWKTSQGPEYYPYVRTLGGVSLFDFEDFDPVRYSSTHPMSSWREFVPYRSQWGAAVWIEIDRQAIANEFVTRNQLVERWNHENAGRHTLMPRIEAAHLAPIPIAAFRRVFICRAGPPNIEEAPIEQASEAQ
jgi:hypothetical protein